MAAVLIAEVRGTTALHDALRAIDISVPARIDGRETYHTETWTICRLLASIAGTGHLPYPLSVTHRDRPDFLIAAAGSQIGVEVTEAASSQYSAYAALGEREFPDAFLEPAHFRWGAPERTADEMRAILAQKRLTSAGWSGESVERDWALFVLDAIDGKIAKLASVGFEKFDQNWLAIYDNTPTHAVHLDRAIGFLLSELPGRWARQPSFDHILIEHERQIIDITAGRVQILSLIDLWK